MAPKNSPEDYFAGAPIWRRELIKLREILTSTQLTETMKWGMPVYTHDGKNVVGISAFKSYFGLWFYQGALLKDERGLLINAQDGKTKAMRQWRMTHSKDIKPRSIKAYLNEAIDLACAGKEIKPNRSKPITLHPLFKDALANDIRAKEAFNELKPGERRAFADYIMDAKQEATKQRRLEKILPMIKRGEGLNDKYKPK